MSHYHACLYWERPDLFTSGALMELLVPHGSSDEGNAAHEVRCKECGTHYTLSFTEEKDWIGGDDGQRSEYVPVGGGQRLVVDWPTGGERRVFWQE